MCKHFWRFFGWNQEEFNWTGIVNFMKNAIICNVVEYWETQNLKKSIYSIISWFPLFILMVELKINDISVSGAMPPVKQK